MLGLCYVNIGGEAVAFVDYVLWRFSLISHILCLINDKILINGLLIYTTVKHRGYTLSPHVKILTKQINYNLQDFPM